jgi:hypothetical protein
MAAGRDSGRMGRIHLLSIDDVHNDTTLQHPRQTSLDGKVVLAILGAVAVRCGKFGSHCVCLVSQDAQAIKSN